MKAFFVNIMNFLLAHYSLYMVVFVMIIMAIVMLAVHFLKKPIKLLTKKIKNFKLRTFANKSLILLVFALSTGIWALLSLVAPAYFTFNVIAILLSSTFSIVTYEFADGVLPLKFKKKNKLKYKKYNKKAAPLLNSKASDFEIKIEEKTPTQKELESLLH